MRKVLTKHRSLMTALCPPVVLFLCLWIAARLPGFVIPSPRYNVLYIANHYPHNEAIFEVIEGRLHIWVTSHMTHSTLPMPKLFVFDVKKKISTEIPIPLKPTVPEQSTLNAKQEIHLPVLDTLTLNPNNQAPDGYTIKLSKTNSARHVLTTTKFGNTLTISGAEKPQPYNMVKFLGWIISDKDGG